MLKKPYAITIWFAVVAFLGYIAYQDIIVDEAGAISGVATQHYSEIQARTGGQKNAEYYGALRAKIAIEEYKKDISEATPNCNCGSEIDKYTEGNNSQWCAQFASWVAKEAGSPLRQVNTSGWRLTNSRQLATHLADNGTWFPKDKVIAEGLEPMPGDFIIYWRGSYEDGLGHVDVVVSNGNRDGTANTVGGNIDNRVELRQNYNYKQHYGFLGFGRPEKE